MPEGSGLGGRPIAVPFRSSAGGSQGQPPPRRRSRQTGIILPYEYDDYVACEALGTDTGRHGYRYG